MKGQPQSIGMDIKQTFVIYILSKTLCTLSSANNHCHMFLFTLFY